MPRGEPGHPDWTGGELADPGGDTPAAKRVRYLRRRWFYCYHHPKWVEYRREAAEDMAFYDGSGQWDPEVLAQLRAEKRAALTINQVRPIVEVIKGYERSARLEITPVPEGQEDLTAVSVLGKLLKRVDQDQDLSFELSDQFGEGAIQGVSTVYVGVDYEDDPIYGKPQVVKTKPFEIIWDPDAQRYDLSDAADVFWMRMVNVDQLKAAFPEHAEDIETALLTYQAGGSALPERIPAEDPFDPYRQDTVDPLLWDLERNQIMVIEGWYRAYTPVWLLVDRRRNTVDEVPDDPAVLEAARKMAAADDLVTLAKRMRKRIEMSVFLPATGQELSHGNPFENDDQAYPFVPFIAYREADRYMGIVRNLKDPQREYNKRRSAMIDNVSRHGQVKWIAKRNSVENPAWFDGGGSAGGMAGWVTNWSEKPEAVSPPAMPSWVVEQTALSKMEMKEISGVNADMVGQQDQTLSGVAIARRQAAGQIVTASIFDNHKRTKRTVGKRVCKRIQQTFTAEKTIRIASEFGAMGQPFEWVTINQREQTVDARGHAQILNDIPSLDYDVIITDSPATPSARAQALDLLMALVEKIPNFAPALADEIVALSDVPNRERVLQRLRYLMAAQGLLDPVTMQLLGIQPPVLPGGVMPPAMVAAGTAPGRPGASGPPGASPTGLPPGAGSMATMGAAGAPAPGVPAQAA